ncbi:MAG: hypothetical protein D6802_01125, partial [Ardenticatenia bacterium]
MKRSLLFFLSISLVFFLALAGLMSRSTGTAHANTGSPCYVDADATGAANGVSWTDAYTTVQDALADANCTEIWVAAGVYYPDEGAGQTNDDRNSTFQLKNGVAIYGGFAGTETARDQRNPTVNITVLSGDLDKNDTTDTNGVVTSTDNITGTNTYHVVTGSGTDSTAVLDGFVITAGQADGIQPDNSVGGGMYNNDGSPTLNNIIFSGNWASNYGGGMYNAMGSPVLSNVTFTFNTAANGGAMANYTSTVTITNTTFLTNTATA